MKELKHQSQPTGDTCASTCIAMLLNTPVQGVIDEFHEAFMKTEDSIERYLSANGVFTEPVLSTQNKMFPEKVYLLTVPSLHKEALNHSILVDLRGDFITILDPNFGKEGKKHYVHFIEGVDFEKDEVQLQSFSIYLEIVEF